MSNLNTENQHNYNDEPVVYCSQCLSLRIRDIDGVSYCDDCGKEGIGFDKCPVCGSTNFTRIERMNGYLAYSRVHGDTRLNDGKMAEIRDRKSM